MSFKGFYLSLKLVETLYGKLCARSLASSIHQYTRTYTVYTVECLDICFEHGPFI